MAGHLPQGEGASVFQGTLLSNRGDECDERRCHWGECPGNAIRTLLDRPCLKQIYSEMIDGNPASMTAPPRWNVRSNAELAILALVQIAREA